MARLRGTAPVWECGGQAAARSPPVPAPSDRRSRLGACLAESLSLRPAAREDERKVGPLLARDWPSRQLYQLAELPNCRTAELFNY